MSRYWSPILRELEPYVPGEQPQNQQYIKLNTNENSYPPSLKVIQAIKEATNASLRLYPDPTCEALRVALAKHYEVTKDNVFIGNGSDEVLALTFLAFFRQTHPILFSDVTYSFYPVYCTFFGIQYSVIPVTDAFEIHLQDYQPPNGGIIFANPNALSGRRVSLPEIQALLNANPEVAVVIDEAYGAFGGESALPLIETFPNLLTLHTLSKSHSLAGLRIGYAIGSPELIEGLERAKSSFNSYTLDRLAIVGGVAAINDDAYFQQTRQQVIHTREWLVAEVAALGCLTIPSQANFVMLQHPDYSGKYLYEELRRQGILARYFDKPRVQNFIRVSIGTDAEMQRFLEILKNILA